ncbi:zinc metallochaperone AztD [Nocardia jejuensis]|uniref:zinc metallochaperone AztD n=1 Tax=Nocardia jejuensis TaxID=328049 RepID=UPI00082BAD9D|nr:zinc metallochaperone AztD [Nocardia jejuensis]
MRLRTAQSSERHARPAAPRRPASRTRKAVALSGLTATVFALGACGADDKSESHSDRAPITDPLAVTYDGGVYLLDGNTLQVASEVKLDGYNRVNPAGDDHHVVVSTADGFRILDAVHAELTDIEFPGPKPGHVVRHANHTVLFTDGTGEVRIFDPSQLEGGTPKVDTYRAAAPHHGVAIELANGNLVLTLGTEEKRTGMVVLDKNRTEIARSEDCPGVHGEATAQGEAVVIGCQNGVLVYRDGKITKVASPTPYGRIGNQSGTDTSPVVLGDYKQDPDAELERPHQVSLIDTRTDTLRLVDLGTSYTFRSFARGPKGEALILGTDGRIHVLDPESGTVTRTIPVLPAWEEPLKWQSPRPNLFVRGDDTYVSDPATKTIRRIDLTTGEITATATLSATPNELSGTSAH